MSVTALASQLEILSLKVDLSLKREFMEVIREVTHVLIWPYELIAFAWLETHELTAVCKSMLAVGLRIVTVAIHYGGGRLVRL